MVDWLTYFHMIRKEEVQRIFGGCTPHLFPAALELGAGDGYQASLLLAYVDRLTLTDQDVSRLPESRAEQLDVRQCDAEAVGETFPARAFDLVFSSNVLERVRRTDLALRGVYAVLRDDGLTVHIVPSPWWKLCQLALFYPDKVVRRLERLAIRPPESGAGKAPPKYPLMPRRGLAVWRRHWPSPHGAYGGHVEELQAFRKQRWLGEFQAAGLRVIQVIKGPVCSGYGFGWERLRRYLERAGLTSEYVYVAVKRGRQSPYEKYFQPGAQGAAR